MGQSQEAKKDYAKFFNDPPPESIPYQSFPKSPPPQLPFQFNGASKSFQSSPMVSFQCHV